MVNVLIAILSLIVGHAPPTRTPVALKADEVFFAVGKAVREAKAQFGDGDSQNSRLLAKMRADVALLNAKWSGSSGTPVPNDYLLSLRSDAKLLDDARKAGSGNQATTLLREAMEDLSIKAAHSQKGFGAGESLHPVVRVTVVTRKDGAEIGGYLVRCNPRAFRDAKDPMFVFNNPSSPTTQALPPGRFIMWVERQGIRSPGVDISVGGEGQAAQKIAIEVP